MQLAISSPELANLERTLNKRFGRRAVKDFMKQVANESVVEAESETVTHLANKFQISRHIVRDHIYYRAKSDGDSLAVVAWSPSRTVPIKKLEPIATKTGVAWRWAGRKRSRKSAFFLHGHVFRRKSISRGQLAPRLPIERVKGPRISWDNAWQSRLEEIIAQRFFVMADKWMNEVVK